MKRKKGLTLIELLAVIAIIAILFVLLIPQINSAINKARETGVLTDFRSYQIALEGFFIENEEEGNLTEETLNTYLDTSLQFDSFFSKEKNPWGYPYELLIQTSDGLTRVSIGSKNENEVMILTVTRNGSTVVRDLVEHSFHHPGQYLSSNPDTKLFGVPKENDTFTFLEFGDFIEVTGYKLTDPHVTIPNHINNKPVEILGSYSFASRTVFPDVGKSDVKIQSVTFPNTLKYIKSSAFQYSDIQDIVLPSSLIGIGHAALGSSNIENFVINSDLKYFINNPILENRNINIVMNYPDSAFKVGSDGSSLYSKDGKILYHGTLRTFNTPEFLEVEELEGFALYSQGLTSFTFPPKVKKLHDWALGYNQLSHITIPSHIAEVENGVFHAQNVLTYTNESSLSDTLILSLFTSNPNKVN